MWVRDSSHRWIGRFARFHGPRSRTGLFPAEPKIEAFLTDLAVQGNVAAATQNQAMHTLVFLSKRVLNQALPGSINAVRATKKITVPVVMTRDAVATILALLDGTAQLVVKLLYGSGLRLMEAVRPRVKDIDYLLQRGTDIRTIQHLLGHNDVATTMIYTHVLQQGGQGVRVPWTIPACDLHACRSAALIIFWCERLSAEAPAAPHSRAGAPAPDSGQARM